MRYLPTLLLIVACLAGCQQQPSYPTAVELYFSPKGGCTEAVVKELDAAKSTVLVQAYSFTSVPIAKALVEAHKRGVKVQVILDKSQRTEKYSSADFVAHAGIPCFIDAQHAIAHNKVMVIDGATVLTGSFNFTRAAEEHNAENLLVIRDKALADKYAANWQAHLDHSEPYAGRGMDEQPAKKPSRRKKAA
ncbi:MAG: phospholipase D family protein [Thermoguttaceae bacterium]